MLKYNARTRRMIRILKALEGRSLEEVFVKDPDLRDDLAREAAQAIEGSDDTLLFPDEVLELERRMDAFLAERRTQLLAGNLSFTGSAGIPPTEISHTYKAVPGRNVIIVPGGLASTLRDIGPFDPGSIWLYLQALSRGRFYDLQLAPYVNESHENDLAPEVLVEAFGELKMLYNRLFSALSHAGWKPQFFHYDWRKDMEHGTVAQELQEQIKELGKSEPVHIITHSQGGIVTRKALSDLVKELGEAAARAYVGRVILLGPATHGAFVAALAVAGSFKQIPILRLFPRPPARVQRVTASFTALYQLMPWNENLVPSLKGADIRKPDFWKHLGQGKIQPERLARAFPPNNKPWLADIDTEYFHNQIKVIVGTHPFLRTPGGVRFRAGRLVVDHDYDLDGDGWVPEKLAILETSAAYRVNGIGHIQLPRARVVIEAVGSLLNDIEPGPPFDKING